MRSSEFNYGVELGSGLPLFRNYRELNDIYFNAPMYQEATSIEDIGNDKKVICDLDKIDWSFTEGKTNFLTHDLHPYPAKFIPQIPGHLIARLSLRGELVLDPFGGSGTTSLEAVRLGRRAVSIDINPIASMIGEVKTCNLDKFTISDLQSLRCAITLRAENIPSDLGEFYKEVKEFIPEIPNIDKWFPIASQCELALLRSKILSMESKVARNIANLALSKIILKASFQDSETRYVSKPREIRSGDTFDNFIIALDAIIQNIRRTQPLLRYGVSKFITADIRNLSNNIVNDSSVDLIVTSPPYGNAMDYHLYHRFRLFWLGFDPKELMKNEIGSHLRHQKEKTGFIEYLEEMRSSLKTIYRLLKPGRHAVLVIGDAKYHGEIYRGAEESGKVAKEMGFEELCIIERQIHKTKRSFASAGRRAISEKLLVLKKPVETVKVRFITPPYRLWAYEKVIQKRELETVLSVKKDNNGLANINPYKVGEAKKLVFTHGVAYTSKYTERTWQAILENGFSSSPSNRKDPKYVTHGLHPYKGKFYPQLAKGLINLCGLASDSVILDPFCGSGTTLLEGYLNGYRSYGCDMNPLAAKIAKAKTGILDVNPDILRESIGAIMSKLDHPNLDTEKKQWVFEENCVEEITRWFPSPVIMKMNYLLKTIRSISDGVTREFFEVIMSSIIRYVSHQDPNDLRIRKRRKLLEDADVFGLFVDNLIIQFERIEKFWSVRGHSPNRFYSAEVIEGDSRLEMPYQELGLEANSVDFILTSPPYATALPYIDTDRLSLLVLFGLDSSRRRPLENELIGSREILNRQKNQIETILREKNTNLPVNVTNYLLGIYERISIADVGFRRKNKPALLLRFFQDMKEVLSKCYLLLKRGGEAQIVIGDNRMKIDDSFERIPTTDYVEEIANMCGFDSVERIDISVTTENLIHMKNAITKNVVLRFKKS